ncbi:AraC family transcriptional regulator [Streptomyces sp. VRA16 Mangrove soil]|uniref:AraC family transcriptional regulator n=1 Tax=Streptomyces sp. VRA16 Mangrove soil TaxID=2817434 RepID=UPI001A9EEB1D|nr:AraC family transcriptional regulator [Streptomyces sp. VRA16 Mangrove soil]MBO1334514.1 AraC family transcriptional regulator [Streptomyces sp. VRA16 Mangrove soil]
MSVIQGTGLLGYRELVSALGADPEPLLRHAGIDPDDVGNPDAFIPYVSHVRAVETAAAVTGTPDFGRRLALRRDIDVLGAVGVAVRTAATVGEGFAIAETYLAAYAPALRVEVQPLDDPERCFFEFEILVDRLPAHQQSLELALGVVIAVLRRLWGPDRRPLAVHFPHAPVTPEDAYRDYYGCPARFGEPRAGFTLRTADLARPVSQDHLAHHALVDYLETVVGGRDRSLAGRVRRLVRPLLPTGRTTLDLVAERFAMHPRTVQRRLATEGVSFNELVDQVRRENAERYIRDTDLTMTHVARLLGYSDQSVLTRSCKRWFGRGPAAHREALAAAREQGFSAPGSRTSSPAP